MSLNDVWEGAARNPFYPLVSKDSQFFVGFSLLLIGKLWVPSWRRVNINKSSFHLDGSFRIESEPRSCGLRRALS